MNKSLSSNKQAKNKAVKQQIKKLDCEAVREKFLASLSMGFSVYTACRHAGISHTTYYAYTRDNPDFLDWIERSKDLYADKFIEVLNMGLKSNDYRFALDVLKAMPNSRFANKIQLEVSQDVDAFMDRLDEHHKNKGVIDVKPND